MIGLFLVFSLIFLGDGVSSQLADLARVMKAGGDDDAIARIDRLIESSRSEEELDTKSIAKTLASAFSLRRDEGDNRLYLALAAALSEFGEEGQKAIVRSLKHKNLKRRPEVRAYLLVALGSFANEKNLKVLTGALRKGEPNVIAAAAEGLAYYRLAKGEVRKQAVEALVKCYVEAERRVRRSPDDESHQDRLEVFEMRIIRTLTELSGETFRNGEDWSKWFEKHKAEDWSRDGDEVGSKAPSLSPQAIFPEDPGFRRQALGR